MTGRKDAAAFAAGLGDEPADGEIGDLVRFAEYLCESAAAVEPPPEFLLSLRADLMHEASTVLVVAERSPRAAAVGRVNNARPLRRRLATLTSALVVTAGAVGLVSMSASALPGDLLYPIKRGVESIELAIQRADDSRGEFQFDRASRRLDEAAALIDNGGPGSSSQLVDAFGAFTVQASSGADSLFADYTATGDDASVESVQDFAQEASQKLSDMHSDVPQDASAAFENAARTVNQMSSQATAFCSTCQASGAASLTEEVQKVIDGLATIPDEGPVESAPQPAATDATPKAPGVESTTAEPKKVPSIPTPSLDKSTSVPDLIDPDTGTLLGDDDSDGVAPGLLGILTDD